MRTDRNTVMIDCRVNTCAAHHGLVRTGNYGPRDRGNEGEG